MKNFLNFVLLTVALLSTLTASAAPGDSLLDQSVDLPEFGSIRYRAPVTGTSGFPIVLFHGIYGGASHRTFRELLPQLDAAGSRVFVMDLPGVGESDRPKREYRIEDIDRFVTLFLEQVVREQSTVVAESIATLSVVKAAATRPDLVRRVVLLSPVGVNTLASPPSAREDGLYRRLYADDNAGIAFYQNLLADNSLRYFLPFAYFDDTLVNEDLLADYRVARQNLAQRWISLSFVGGQLYRSFRDSSEGVFKPVLAIFGANYEPFGDSPLSTAADFASVRPEFTYEEIAECGSLVQREKPTEVARLILDFAVRD